MALCLLAPFGKDQKDAQQPLATPAQNSPCERLCGGQACGLVREKPSGAKPPSFPDGKAPGFSALCGPVCGVSTPGGGTTRPRPFRGDLGPTGPSLAEKKETTSSPGWGRIWGCDSQAGERLGVAGASPAGSPRPAEPVVAGFLPGPTARKIRGRLGGLGVTTGVRNRKFPGGKPFLRVSPPGSTKG